MAKVKKNNSTSNKFERKCFVCGKLSSKVKPIRLVTGFKTKGRMIWKCDECKNK